MRPDDLSGVLERRILFDLRHSAKIICKELAQMISVLSRIRHDMTNACQPFNQAACLRAIAPLTGGDHKPDRQPKRVNGSVDFSGQGAF